MQTNEFSYLLNEIDRAIEYTRLLYQRSPLSSSNEYSMLLHQYSARYSSEEYSDRLTIQYVILLNYASILQSGITITGTEEEVYRLEARSYTTDSNLEFEIGKLLCRVKHKNDQGQLVLAIRYEHQKLAEIVCKRHYVNFNQSIDYQPKNSLSPIQNISPLIAAIIEGNTSIIESIFLASIRFDKNPNFESSNEETKKLGYATPVQAAITQSNVSFIQSWLEKNLPVTNEDIGRAVEKKRSDIVELLLSRTSIESTPEMLTVAFDHRSVKIFRLLHQNLSESNRSDVPQGMDALIYAIASGNLMEVNRLKKDQSLSAQELELAAMFGQRDILRAYVTKSNVNQANVATKKTLLMLAIESHDLATIQWLIEKEANPLLTDSDNKTILDYVHKTEDKIKQIVTAYFTKSQPEPDDDLEKHPIYKTITSPGELFQTLCDDVMKNINTSYCVYLGDKKPAPYALLNTTRALCNRLRYLNRQLEYQDGNEQAYEQLNRVLYACQKAICYPSDKNNERLLQMSKAQTVDTPSPTLRNITYMFYGLALIIFALGILAFIPTLHGNVFLSFLLAVKLKSFAATLVSMASQISFVPHNAVLGTIGTGSSFAVASLTYCSARLFGPKRVGSLAYDFLEAAKKEIPPKIGMIVSVETLVRLEDTEHSVM